jgi:urea transporter
MAEPDRIVLYAALVATSGAALLVGVRMLGLRWAALGGALGLVLEAIGLAVVFFVANLVAGISVVIGLRLAGVFVSVYAMDDLVLAILSAGQAFLFQAWRKR